MSAFHLVSSSARQGDDYSYVTETWVEHSLLSTKTTSESACVLDILMIRATLPPLFALFRDEQSLKAFYAATDPTRSDELRTRTVWWRCSDVNSRKILEKLSLRTFGPREQGADTCNPAHHPRK